MSACVRSTILARHAWHENATARSVRRSKIAPSMRSEILRARRKRDGYRAFCRDTKRIYDMLEKPFLRAPQPSMGALIGADGFRGLLRAAADQAVLVDVVGARALLSRSAAAAIVRALRHLLRLVALSIAPATLDAGRACRAARASGASTAACSALANALADCAIVAWRDDPIRRRGAARFSQRRPRQRRQA